MMNDVMMGNNEVFKAKHGRDMTAQEMIDEGSSSWEQLIAEMYDPEKLASNRMHLSTADLQRMLMVWRSGVTKLRPYATIMVGTEWRYNEEQPIWIACFDGLLTLDKYGNLNKKQQTLQLLGERLEYNRHWSGRELLQVHIDVWVTAWCALYHPQAENGPENLRRAKLLFLPAWKP